MSDMPEPNASIDLTGEVCPMNFVRTKLQLEEMESGEILAVMLAPGSAIENVPRSIKDEGHKIIQVTRIDGNFQFLIKKA